MFRTLRHPVHVLGLYQRAWDAQWSSVLSERLSATGADPGRTSGEGQVLPGRSTKVPESCQRTCPWDARVCRVAATRTPVSPPRAERAPHPSAGLAQDGLGVTDRAEVGQLVGIDD